MNALGFLSIVPERAVDAQSLIAASDLVVSAGGSMNREAVALDTPVYTTYGGRLGGVDESLIRSAPSAADRRPGARASKAARREEDQPRPGAVGRAYAWHGPMSARGPATQPPSPLPSPVSPGAGGDDHGNESLAERYARIAHAYEGRAIDPVLRTFDIAISGTALILLSPLVAVVAAATLVTSGRPVLNRGTGAARGACSACTSSARWPPTPRRGWGPIWGPS